MAKKNLSSSQRRIHPILSLLLLLLCSGVIFLIVISIQPGSLHDSLQSINRVPNLLLLNFAPVFFLALVFYCIFGNVFTAAGFTAFIAEGLSYANLLKMEGRNDPLVPGDVMLLKESLVAAGDYHLNLHPRIILIMVCSIGGFFLLSFFLKSRRIKILPRLIVLLLVVAIFAGMCSNIYADKDFYKELPDVDKSNVSQVFYSFGFPYCFLHNLNLYPVEKPEGYQASEVRQWEQVTASQAAPMDVDIIMLMGEAFSDLSDEAAFMYSPEENPTYLYHQIADSHRAISGHIVVPDFGAGTANTEFDVLTGMQTHMISEDLTSAFRVVRHDIGSIARVYQDHDYSNWFMHPGKSWFYNRSNVFDYLGIKDQTFEEAFPKDDWDSVFCPDSVLLEKVEEKYINTPSPSFSYITTYENHQTYRPYKYKFPITEEVPTTMTLDYDVREQLEVYFTGIRHTSQMVYSLAEYLDTVDRPTILVFFGDHRPAMGADYQCYRAIGSDVGQEDSIEQLIYAHETSFTIWGNEAFCEAYDFASLVEGLDLPSNPLISASYLSSLVYEMTGMTGSDAYFDYLSQARRILPVISQGSYMLPDGTCTDTLNAEQAEVVRKLDWWLYYRIKTGVNR